MRNSNSCQIRMELQRRQSLDAGSWRKLEAHLRISDAGYESVDIPGYQLEIRFSREVIRSMSLPYHDGCSQVYVRGYACITGNCRPEGGQFPLCSNADVETQAL